MKNAFSVVLPCVPEGDGYLCVINNAGGIIEDTAVTSFILFSRYYLLEFYRHSPKAEGENLQSVQI